MAQWLGALLLLRVTTMIAKLMVNSNPSLIVASWDNILPDNYLCLVESNKQQIKEIRSKRQLLSESGFVLRLVPPSLSTDRRIRNHRNSSASLTTNTRTCVVKFFASLGFVSIVVVLGPPISFNFFQTLPTFT